MKRMVTDTMLMPLYVSRFACIGGDCEDTCCSGWRIALDPESCLTYTSSTNPVLRPLFSQYVHQNPAAKTAREFGRIDLREDACGSCPFLTEAKLCLIYQHLGESALSDTCTNYPREIHRIGDLHQMTLTLSCPEAARLALLAEDAFELVGLEASTSQGTVVLLRERSGLNLAALDEVRTLCFQILRTQDISLSDRLKVIGRLCEELTDLIQAQKVEALPALLRDLDNDLESGAALSRLAGQTELPEVQALVAGTLFWATGDTSRSTHVQEIMALAATGLGIQAGQPLDSDALVKAYQSGTQRLAQALEAVPWLFEHFLFNEFLREVFPWGKETPRQHFQTLVIHYALTRLVLVGRSAASDRPLSPLELAETVQAASRRYTHDANFDKEADQLLLRSGWSSLELIQSLL